ncbi:signal recognition particle subunit SRP68 [Angomonas deanei]|nr:signal recognition particle subunit SRP68 [Angomonas deanei]|eukprot:EPY34461.1 signal recognition particle subunit SRP68 [Angomonas deanei]
MPIEFDLTLFLKETQLQHGLRAEDYSRYHEYLSNRLATLRKQLHFSNEKKKFLHKEVTKANATDERHLMLLALYSERCWAAAEAQLEKVQQAKIAKDSTKDDGGIPPTYQYRKRLNKAVKWCEKLTLIAQAVGSTRLQQECQAYEAESRGRCAVSHGLLEEAKQCFLKAREQYFNLLKQCSDSQRSVLIMKTNELDDRVVYCMQHLGENLSSYNPPRPELGGLDDGESGESTQSTLSWNGRQLVLTNIKVKEALREARHVPVTSTKEKLLETSGVISVGQMNKVLDLMDRRTSFLNDALAHTRQDLRNAPEGSAQKTEFQLIVHYLLFQIAEETFGRNIFLAEVYGRRFAATDSSLQSSSSSSKKGKRSDISPALYASPLEVVRLYQAASESVGELELLPGVSGRADVEEMESICRAGRLLYLGESWRVLGDLDTSAKCYSAALHLVKDATSPQGKSIHSQVEHLLFRQIASAEISKKTELKPVPAYLIDATTEVGVPVGVVPFPPDFQSVPQKPVFVDIASTYVEYPTTATSSRPTTTSDRQTHAAKSSGEEKDAKKEKSWGLKWGW